jgi:hypothetical protein
VGKRTSEEEAKIGNEKVKDVVNISEMEVKDVD